MWIMGQNEKSLFNMNRFDGIHIYTEAKRQKFTLVGIDHTTGSEIELAEYREEDRAKEILTDLLVNIDKTRYVLPIK